MIIKYTQLLNKSLPLQPIYAVVGQEDYFRKDAVKKIIDLVQKKIDPKAYIVELHWENKKISTTYNPLANFLDELKTASMFTSHKIAILYQADRFLHEYSHLLEPLLDHPPHSLTLILETTNLDMRTKFNKKLKEKYPLIHCQKLYDKPPPWKNSQNPHDTELCQWLVRYAKSLHKNLTPPNAYLLIEMLGNQVGKLAKAIESLREFVKQRKNITKKDILHLFTQTKKSTQFEYVDALLQKNIQQSLITLENIFREGLTDTSGEKIQSPPAIASILLSTLTNKFRQLLHAKQLQLQNLSLLQITQKLNVKKFLLPTFQKELEQTSLHELKHTLQLLHQLDEELKSSSGMEKILYELLTLQICTHNPNQNSRHKPTNP